MKQTVRIGIMMSLAVIVSGCGNPKGDQVDRHDARPQADNELPADLLLKMEALKNSPYYKHVKELEQHVVGRTVTRTEAGTSGFLLYLDNGKWILAHLAENEFRWKTGDGVPSEPNKELMNSSVYGDASLPLKENVPYANQTCDFSAQVKKVVGKKITGLSHGERCFNFCFPEGRELDVTLRLDRNGKQAYRVFWEQW